MELRQQIQYHNYAEIPI